MERDERGLVACGASAHPGDAGDDDFRLRMSCTLERLRPIDVASARKRSDVAAVLFAMDARRLLGATTELDTTIAPPVRDRITVH